MQVTVPPGAMDADAQVRDDNAGDAAVRAISSKADVPFTDAVTFAETFAVTFAPAVAENVVVDAPTGTVTEAGIVSAALLEAMETAVGAAAVAPSDTVHVVELPAVSDAAAHARAVTATPPAAFTVTAGAFIVTPLYEPVTTAETLAATGATLPLMITPALPAGTVP